MDIANPTPGFSVLGDSISTLGGCIPAGWRVHYEGEVHVDGVTAPEHTWWGQVIDHFGGRLVGNASFSGSCVEGFGFPAGWSPQRLTALKGQGDETPDVVLVFMGINDFGWGGARNQTFGLSKSASAVPDDLPTPHQIQEAVGSEALELFQQAYDRMLAGIRELAPQAQIWCLNLTPGTTPADCGPSAQFTFRLRGLELDDYNRAIDQAAAAHDAQVVDLRSLGFCVDAVDGVHPSALGMRQIAQAVISAMEGQKTAELEQMAAAAPQPVDACPKPSCAGCPFAPTTPTSWALHCTDRE
ncbi:MAG: SGNH/GDSL hydrolase family protein [Coriobacteriia bacterium]|nr:SGNH/GDSL hydrolase family protein [Coriobacteriia bacterium]